MGHKRDGPHDLCKRCIHPGHRTRQRRARARQRAYLAALAVWEGEGGSLPPANPKLTLKQRGLKQCTACGAELPYGWFRHAGNGKLRGRCRLCERPQKAKDNAVRRQRMYFGRELPWSIPTETIRTLQARQNYRCACGCGRVIIWDFEIDHKIPVKRGGRHVISNIQLLHPICNRRKGSRLT